MIQLGDKRLYDWDTGGSISCNIVSHGSNIVIDRYFISSDNFKFLLTFSFKALWRELILKSPAVIE